MRRVAVRTLRGVTLAEARIHDSAIVPIGQTVAEGFQPILIITIDDHEMEVAGRDLFHGNVPCGLVIEAAIAARVEIAGEESVISIQHTDEGMELALDLMGHQAIAALTRERSDWSGFGSSLFRPSAIRSTPGWGAAGPGIVQGQAVWLEALATRMRRPTE